MGEINTGEGEWWDREAVCLHCLAREVQFSTEP